MVFCSSNYLPFCVQTKDWFREGHIDMMGSTVLKFDSTYQSSSAWWCVWTSLSPSSDRPPPSSRQSPLPCVPGERCCRRHSAPLAVQTTLRLRTPDLSHNNGLQKQFTFSLADMYNGRYERFSLLALKEWVMQSLRCSDNWTQRSQMNSSSS